MINNWLEVAYANTQEQKVIRIDFISFTETVKLAIERSGIINYFPEIDLTQNKVGIFGKIVDLNLLISPGDRVEIYRPLICDPKQARRLRLLKKSSMNKVVK